MTDGPLLTKSMQRCLANDPRQCASVMKDVEDVFNPHIPFSKKPNARYGPAIFHAIFHVIMMGLQHLASQYSDILRPHGDGRQHHTCLPEATARPSAGSGSPTSV